MPSQAQSWGSADGAARSAHTHKLHNALASWILRKPFSIGCHWLHTLALLLLLPVLTLLLMRGPSLYCKEDADARSLSASLGWWSDDLIRVSSSSDPSLESRSLSLPL